MNNSSVAKCATPGGSTSGFDRVVSECKVYSDLDLYLGVMAIDWPALFGPGATFAVIRL